jgi:ribosomal protein S18 acetylase RimI-like enzyme
MLEIRTYHPDDEEQVINLWKTIFPDSPPHNDPLEDIHRKMKIQSEMFFVALEDKQVVGTTMAGYDGHRGWVYYVAVHPDFRRKGIGTALMQRAEESLQKIGCSKLNLQIRADNSLVQDFYKALGYDVEERISMGKKLSHK